MPSSIPARAALRHVALSLATALLLGLVPGASSAEELGSISGRVLDEQGLAVVGAEVALDGGPRATTGADGGYLLAGVPAGERRVAVRYLGAPGATDTVTVAAGRAVTLDLRLARYGEQVEVRARPLLLGQASALNQQKNALAIMNVVSAEQIGRFPDPNAAEATQRIPGITLGRDQGEGRYVLVRGTEARLNSTTVDGERIPSPEADGRDVALDVIPADLLQAIEVTKALTPDMDGDAIGGTVNLVTRRAPERRRLAGTVAAGWNELVEDEIQNANLTYGSRFGEDDRWGLVLAGSRYETDRGSDNFEVSYDDGELDELELRDYVLERERNGLNAALDARLSERSSAFARYLWNDYADTELRRAMVNGVSDGEIARELRDRVQESRIAALSVGGETLLGGSDLVQYQVAWNRAREATPDQITSTFLQEDVEFDPNVGPGAIDPDDVQANPLNQDLGAFVFDEVERSAERAEEEDVVGSLDYSHAFYRDASFAGRFQVGAKARFKTKEQDADVFALSPEDDLALLDVLSSFRSQTPFFRGRYDVGLFADPRAIRELLASAAFEVEEDLEENLADFDAAEDTLAGYALAELELGARTTLLGGLRVESTETEYDAFELEVDEEGDPVALSPVSGGTSYTEALPMLHLKVRLDDRTNLRAALTRTLARPNFIDLAPYQLILREDEEIERGNPDLDVTTAWNLDLFAERYLDGLGLVAGGIFYKRLDDNVFTFRSEELFEGDLFDVTQKRNGDDAELFGAELMVQRRFASGFGVYLNLTWVDSEARYPDRPEARLQGQAEVVGNLALSYERGRFSGRAMLNHHGDYLFEVGEEPAEDLYVDDHLQLDLAADWRLTPHLTLALQLLNLTDEPYLVYEGSPDRPIQEEIYSWWGTLGVKVDF